MLKVPWCPAFLAFRSPIWLYMSYSKRCKEEGHPVPVHRNPPDKTWFKLFIVYGALIIANANANANNNLNPLRR
eukprot:5553735-Heterocapsa_arctica.AAC.1